LINLDMSESSLFSLTDYPVMKVHSRASSIILEHKDTNKLGIHFSMFENTKAGGSSSAIGSGMLSNPAESKKKNEWSLSSLKYMIVPFIVVGIVLYQLCKGSP